MSRRRPLHAKPLAGATFALGMGTFLGVGGFLSELLEGRGADGAGFLVFTLGAFAFAALLFWMDLAVLKMAGHARPDRYARLWRWAWLGAPAVGAVVGIVVAAASVAG